MKNFKNNVELWNIFNKIKIMAVHQLHFTHEQRIILKQEIDSLFYQATGNKICPAWWIGTLG